jgi:hypothetical protein
MSGGGGVTIPGPDYSLTLGGGTHIDTDLDNIHIKEVAPITINSNLAVTEPIVTQATSKSDSSASLDLKVEPLDLKIEPLKVSSDSNSEIDIKPLAIDSCQTLKLAPLPPMKLEQPYSQHFGMTFMGMELWGFTISGKSEMNLCSPAKSQHYGVQIPEPCGCCGETPHKSSSTSVPSRSGLRVRVK